MDSFPLPCPSHPPQRAPPRPPSPPRSPPSPRPPPPPSRALRPAAARLTCPPACRPATSPWTPPCSWSAPRARPAHAVLHALDREGRRLTSSSKGRGKGRGRDGEPIVLRGPWATERTDFTARISARDLPSDTQYEGRAVLRGRERETGRGRRRPLRDSPGHRSDGAQSFVWTADTAGQGYGINPGVGGMFGYGRCAPWRPTSSSIAGDTIYADGPIEESIEEPTARSAQPGHRRGREGGRDPAGVPRNATATT